MANCISEVLFGYNETHKNCYDFKSYLRYLSLNLRMYKILFPEWIVHLTVDKDTYASPYGAFFDYHAKEERIHLHIVDKAPLCKMMLYRLYPIFARNDDGAQKYDRVICRDIDSLATYRERQAVEYWIKKGKTAHAITDSISHNIPLMGGMVGFQSSDFRHDVNVRTFDQLLELGNSVDFSNKGSDQVFLNRVVLPRVAQSITEHYVLGLPQSFRGDCFNYIEDVPVEDIPPALRETNILVNHIGQAGFIMEPVLAFLQTHETEVNTEYFETIEKKFPEIFYWHLTGEMLKKEEVAE